MHAQPVKTLRSLAFCLFALAMGGCVTDGEALTASPTGTADSLIIAGDARRANGDFAGAAALYRSAYESGGEEKAAPLVKLGETLSAAGAYTDAAETFREALSLAPTNADIHRGLANALIGLGQPGLAIPYYRDALALTPEDWRIYLGLGVAQDLSGNPAEALLAYRQGLALTPDNPDLINNLSLSQALAGDTAAAAGLLEPLIHLYGSEQRFQSTLAIVYALGDREQEAARLMAESVSSDAVARNLATLRNIRAMRDHARKAMAIRAVVLG